MSQEAKRRLSTIVEAQPVFALITSGSAGYPRARMVTRLNRIEANHIDFATDAASRKVREIAGSPKVALYFTDPKTLDWACLEGTTAPVADPDTRRRYFEEHKSFENRWSGPDDPGYMIFRVNLDRGEYQICDTEEKVAVEF